MTRSFRSRADMLARTRPYGSNATEVAARAARTMDMPPSIARTRAISGCCGSIPRLDAERTSFAAEVDRVRRKRAEGFLCATDVSIAEVSWLLGFAEQSAFTRAFRRWTGMAPTEWRRARTGAPRRRG